MGKRLQKPDEPGLIFRSMTGYNPAEAVPFWKRMAADNKGEELPEINETYCKN